MDNILKPNSFFEDLLTVDDNSITDYETIRQIGLLSYVQNSITNDTKSLLYKKVKREYQYCGLYPTTMKTFDIISDNLK